MSLTVLIVPLIALKTFFKPQYIKALGMRKPIVILGDLNCNLLNTTSRECKLLTEMMCELNLKQIIESPVRIADISQSLIDVILVNSPKTVRDSGVINCTKLHYILINDHLPVYVTLKLKPIKPPPIKSERLLSIFSVNDVNEKLKIFDEVLQATLDLHTPIKTVKVRRRPCPFVTPEIQFQSSS